MLIERNKLMEWYIVGTIAALFTTFGFVPQIIKMYKTKSVGDVSIITLFQFSIGVTLWALYGAHIKDLIIAISNIITLATLIITIILYYRYYEKQRDISK